MKSLHLSKNRFLGYGLLFFICVGLSGSSLSAQELFTFFEKCNDCRGKVKSIKTTQIEKDLAYNTPRVQKFQEYNEQKEIEKTIFKVDGVTLKTIYYNYIDSMLIYEQHVQPGKEDYFLVYQYFKKQLPTKIIKVDADRRIIQIGDLDYNEKLEPVVLKIYNVLGEMLERRNVEYSGSNHVVIRTFNPELELSSMQKFERLCKFNTPYRLKKRDFRDVVTRPINLKMENNTLEVVNGVLKDKKEKIQIEELTYDEQGNWISKKTFELKTNRNKRRLVREIRRDIEYY